MSLTLDGRPVARAILSSTRDELASYVTRTGHAPELAVLLAGSDAGARAYFRAIRRTFRTLEIPVRGVELADDVDEREVRAALASLNGDPRVAGIIVLQPLPAHLPRWLPSLLIDPRKDVDGVTPESAGRLALGLDALEPSTPAGGMEILRHYGIDPAGKRAVVIGRSAVVGKPLALMLLAAQATVTICHRGTRDLAEITRQADILAAAAGRPQLVTRDMVKPGAVVLDFGVNVVEGRVVGDVSPDVAEVAGAMTPVPGGTGTVTNAVLARNTVRAALARVEGRAGAAFAERRPS